MLLLLAFVIRAVALEFRGKELFRWWRRLWDVCFCIVSFVVALVLGVAIGNLIFGIPLGPDKEFVGTFLGLFHPYALLAAVFVIAFFIMHGAIYAAAKVSGEFRQKLQALAKRLVLIFVVTGLAVALAAWFFAPHITAPFRQ